MTHQMKYNYTQDQLRNKYNAIRQMLSRFKALVEEAGVGWDSTMNTITIELELWEKLLKVNKNARKFKKKGCPLYDELCRIFGDTSITSYYAHLSTRAPSSSTDNSDSLDKFGENKDLVDIESAPTKVAQGKSVPTLSKKVKNHKRDNSSTNLQTRIAT
ncbi:hypothetical protein CsSME_00015689 [Camellia sinensis var. sinensis]